MDKYKKVHEINRCLKIPYTIGFLNHYGFLIDKIDSIQRSVSIYKLDGKYVFVSYSLCRESVDLICNEEDFLRTKKEGYQVDLLESNLLERLGWI